MLPSRFAKLVDDVLREELLALNLDYEQVIEGIDEPGGREGCVIRLKGEYEDIEIIAREASSDREALTAQLRRKLRFAMDRSGGD